MTESAPPNLAVSSYRVYCYPNPHAAAPAVIRNIWQPKKVPVVASCSLYFLLRRRKQVPALHQETSNGVLSISSIDWPFKLPVACLPPSSSGPRDKNRKRPTTRDTHRFFSSTNFKKIKIIEISPKTTTQRRGRRNHPSADSAQSAGCGRSEMNLPASMRIFRNRQFSLIASSE